jgi:uncharacterized protein (DUF1015 family)
LAVIKPFRAVRYEDKLLKDAASLVAPPYDVISEAQKEHYYDLSPYNVIRLILGKQFPEDADGQNQYTRARDFISLWLKKGVLVHEGKDSIYGYSQVFKNQSGDVVKRRGFVALVELSNWGEKGVFPHERTNKKPKADRQMLAKTTGFSLSFIFSLFSDESGKTKNLIKKITTDRELARYKDEDEVEHVFTICDDAEIHQSLAKALEDNNVFVADGHHRYETALAIKEEMMKDGNKPDSLNYVMMYFCPMEGEGITILPSHRVITIPDNFDDKKFVEEVGRYFEVEKINSNSAEEGASEFLGRVEVMGKGSIGCSLGDDNFYILKLMDIESVQKFFPSSMHDLVKDLDVTILRSVIVEGIMGIDNPDIVYTKDGAEAIKMSGDAKKAAFLINPTKIEEVREVSLMGERMPQKSTYFYPKVSSGLLLYKLID